MVKQPWTTRWTRSAAAAGGQRKVVENIYVYINFEGIKRKKRRKRHHAMDVVGWVQNGRQNSPVWTQWMGGGGGGRRRRSVEWCEKRKRTICGKCQWMICTQQQWGEWMWSWLNGRQAMCLPDWSAFWWKICWILLIHQPTSVVIVVIDCCSHSTTFKIR